MFILHSIVNARELGGYELPDGRRIKHGLLLRGGALGPASEQDLDEMADRYHVAKVFDFRTSMELKASPDRQVRGARNIWLPAFNEESHTMEAMTLPQEAYRDLGNWLVRHAHEPKVQAVARGMYLEMVRTEFTRIQYAGFLQNIVNTPEGAVYWHCSQGKDRTGMGAAFILAALGADRDLIMKDYEMSDIYYRDELDRLLPMVSTPGEKAAIQTFIGVNREYFKLALDWIDEQFGSMYEFLTGPLCLSLDDMGILRERYLEY